MSHTYLYTTDRIGLTPLSSRELNGKYPEWFLDAEVNQFNSHYRFPTSRDSASAFVQSLANDRTKIVCAVYWLSTNEHIGNISLQQIDTLNQSAEIAFLFGEKQYWGKGVGEESAKLLMAHGHKYLKLRRYSLGCLAENVGMNRLAEKLGFQLEGTLKQALWQSGSYSDVNLFGYVYKE